MIFTIEGMPVPWPKKAITKTGKVYRKDIDGKYAVWEQRLLLTVKTTLISLPSHARMFPCDDALSYWSIFVFPRPKSVNITKRPFPNVRPDLDNLNYGVWNSLQGILWKDDAQIVYVTHSAKCYADRIITSANLPAIDLPKNFIGLVFGVNKIR